MREVFLDKNRSIYSTNKESNLNVNFTQKGRLYPFDAIQANIDRYQLYNEERDASNKFRLLFTLNPVCSNVLFNMRTEVVKNEGSVLNCTALVTDDDVAKAEPNAINSSILNREQAISDTEYSHPDIGQWVYHCGLDIFNNHRLRTNSFIYIGKIADMSDREQTDVYNTMSDFKRDKNGEKIEEVLIDGVSNEKRNPRVYQLDNILTFQEAVQQNLIVRNGWYGFVNKGGIEIPNGKLKGMSVNKVMNNNKACEIYNMYPDISLFSFIPKYNKEQKRSENNWDFCLTYPYFSDKELFKVVNGDKDGISIISSGVSTINGEDYVWFKTLLPHNLLVGDYVRLFTTATGTTFNRVRVDKIGDLNGNNKKNVFMVMANRTPLTVSHLKKDADGVECKYYFRLFKRIKNLDGSDFSMDLSKLSFGENIYGDRLAQLTILDTVDLTNLLDNLDRPLSEIYLTILKRNKGWDLWYNSQVYNSSEVEFSHCFGPLTSGLDLPEEISEYNIHKIYNCISGEEEVPTPLPKNNVSDEVTITIDDEYFYGDVVEFNPTTFDETVLSNVYYRFNTAQREIKDLGFESFDLASDDYDENGFRVSAISEYSCFMPEGYYYQPHYKIKLHDIRETENRFLAPVVKPLSGTTPVLSSITDDIEAKYIDLTAATDYDYYPGDVFGICKYNTANTAETKVYWGTVSMAASVDVEGVSGEVKTYPVLTIDVEDFPFDDISEDDEFALTDGTVPQYAVYNPIQQTFIWKDVLPPSETSSEMETYDMPFSNGAFYAHENITLFLRRQDPFNEYGLQDNFNYDDVPEQEKRRPDETEDEFKLRVNPNYLLTLMTKEREVATDLLKFTATDIINNCL